MTHRFNVNKLAFYTVSAAVLAASQTALAHTRLETATVVEGTRVHNAVNIGHGCADPSGAKSGEGTLKNQPTFGTTVLFPNAVSFKPIIGIDSTSDNGANKVIAYKDASAADYYSPLVGIGTLIRTGGPFPFTDNHVDSKNNKDGFWAGGKAYDQVIATTVQVPFYSAAVSINAKSCARSVTFALAIADICNASAQSPKIGDAQALFWSPIPTSSKTATSSTTWTGVPGGPFGAPVADETRGIVVGPKFSNYDGWSNGDVVGMGAAGAKPGDGFNSPATLKITRDLTKNPLPAGCTGNGGKGDDVYVYPSAEQINAELSIWEKPNQTGTTFWK